MTVAVRHLAPTLLPENFWGKVRKTESCWLWTGYISSAGYGQIQRGYRGPRPYVHRLVYALAKGPIPAGLCVLHTCDTPPCVNPDHLWLGTKGDNARDMVRKGRNPAHTRPHTHCKRGHALVDGNRYVTKRGRQECRTCLRKRHTTYMRQYRVTRRVQLDSR